MRFLLQTIVLSTAFTALGALAYDAAAEYSQRAELRRPVQRVPAGNPGIPDVVRDGLRQRFGGR